MGHQPIKWSQSNNFDYKYKDFLSFKKKKKKLWICVPRSLSTNLFYFIEFSSVLFHCKILFCLIPYIESRVVQLYPPIL